MPLVAPRTGVEHLHEGLHRRIGDRNGRLALTERGEGGALLIRQALGWVCQEEGDMARIQRPGARTWAVRARPLPDGHAAAG